MASLFDLSDIVDMCSETYEVTRRSSSGMYADGLYYKNGDEKTFDADGSFQPVRPKELIRQPELSRSDDAHWLFTECKLSIGGALGTADDEEPDRVCRGTTGVVYEPKSEENWNHQGNFYKYLLVRAGQ